MFSRGIDISDRDREDLRLKPRALQYKHGTRVMQARIRLRVNSLSSLREPLHLRNQTFERLRSFLRRSVRPEILSGSVDYQ